MMLRMRCYWFLVIWVSVLELFTCAPTTTTISETTKPSVEFSNLPNGLHSSSAWQPQFYQYYLGQHFPLTVDTKKLIIPYNTLYNTHHHHHYRSLNNNIQYNPFPKNFKDPNSLHVALEKDMINEQKSPNSVSLTRRPVVISNKEEIVKINDVVERKEFENNKKNPTPLAPYRLHPLFHYLKNNNTLQKEKIIRFRTGDDIKQKDITTLILKPVATAVAGVEGKAISTPVSRAMLREGTNVDILFEPEAVAIAGPGGIAHAESDLEISYEEYQPV